MKLHKSKAYEREGKPYFSWKVNLPPDAVQALGWEHKQELEAVVKKDGILLRPVPVETSRQRAAGSKRAQ